MTDRSRATAATARWRLRLAGVLPPLAPCPVCGLVVRSTRTAPLCSRCWRRSDAGREWDRLRVQARRRRVTDGEQAG